MAEPPDRIEVVRTGGFAGIARRGSVDLADAPPDAREEAGQALDEIRQAAARPAGVPQPDAFTYSVAASRAGRREELTLHESAVPESVRPFLDRLLGAGPG
jgi:hypothetical protein